MIRPQLRRFVAEKPDHGHRRLLRAHHQWPRSGCPSEPGDEITSFHFASTVKGREQKLTTSRPDAM
jgi:hypothetical protein